MDDLYEIVQKMEQRVAALEREVRDLHAENLALRRELEAVPRTIDVTHIDRGQYRL